MLLNAAPINAAALNASAAINYEISVDDLLHAHGLDAPSIVENGVLVPADLLHTHDLDAAGLVHNYNLPAADLTHAHAVDGTRLVGPITELADDFEDGVIHPKWAVEELDGASVAESGGQLVVTMPGISQGGLKSAATYDGTGFAMALETDVVQPSEIVQPYMWIEDPVTGSSVYIYAWDDVFHMEYWDNVAVDYDANVTVPFDPVAMKWMRLRHDPVSGLIHTETSPDGVQWTIRGSSATDYFDVSALRVYFGGGTTGGIGPQEIAFNHFLVTIEAVLASSGLIHAHSVDAAGLVQNYIIIPADLLHGHAEDATGLTIGYVLAPAELVHGHLVDGSTVTQVHLLVSSDLTHAVTFDGTLVVLPQIGEVRGILVVSGTGGNRVAAGVGNRVASTYGRLKVA